jgi:ferredoxin-NADP reductase/DMSO/TMAO reductase YedYZ heme-binding membrane subunit
VDVIDLAVLPPRAGARRLPSIRCLPLAVLVAGAASVVTLWWRAAAPAVGAGATLIDAGRLTGLLAGYVALVQVILRARLGAVERTLGTNAINSAHRLLGGYVLALVAGHIVLITAGYQRAGRASLTDQIVSLLRDYPYVWWALVGVGLLLTVAGSSLPIIRRRVPYEVWHAIHLLGYVALTLAFFHQIANGEQLRHAGWPRTTWTVLWAAVAFLLLYSRWLRPVVRAVRHRLVVRAVRPESAGTVSVRVSGRDLDRFPAEAGQYFRWRFLTGGRWHVAHPYSLSAEPDGKDLRFTATVAGRFSKSLPALQPGVRVVAEGPCGGLTVPQSWPGPVLLIAGGVGVTPLRALFAVAPATSLTLIYRGHSAERMPLRGELDRIADRRGAAVHYLVGPRSDPAAQLCAERIATLCPEVRRALIRICGSGSFVRHVRPMLTDLGVPDRHVRAESFELA